MSSIPTMSKVVIACKTAPTLNSQLVRTLFSSPVHLKSDYNGKKGNGALLSKAVPRNIEEINSSVKVKFSPHRTRDASSARIDVKMSQPSGTFGQEFMGSQGAKASQKINTRSRPSDSHVEVYDATNSVSLSSVMQSNVPKPFETKGTEAPAHLGMPGGQWSQGDKYVSGDLHDHHDRNILKKHPGMGQPTSMYMKYPKKYTGMGYSSMLFLYAQPPLASFLAFDAHQTFATNTSACGFCSSSILTTQSIRHVWRLESRNSLYNSSKRPPLIPFVNANVSAWCEVLSGRPQERQFSISAASLIHSSSMILSQAQGDAAGLSQRQKLKRAVKEYGATVIVFHITIALASLGFFYLLVSSGIDMSGLIDRLGINLATLEQKSSPPEPSSGGERPSDEPPKTDDEGRKRVQSVAAGVSTFVLAYAIHKVFAPVRIGITLTATPFIVRHLRKIGFLKPPKSV